ncbi:MAG: hypothetical protein ACTSR3_20920 [Candidatus Helarchaeota archaeon]
MVWRKEVALKGDKEGFIGRSCPKYSCRKFFKIKISEFIKSGFFHHYCPYCGLKQHKNEFLTTEQQKYIISIAQKEAIDMIAPEFKKLERKFSQGLIRIKVQIPDIRIQNYIEKSLSNVIICPNCNNTYITLEPSFFCPYCGKLPPITQWRQTVHEIQNNLFFIQENELSDETSQELKEHGFFRRIIENNVKDLVTGFETYCKDKFAELISSRLPPNTAESIIRGIGNSFQNLRRGNNLFEFNLGYSYRNSISNAQCDELKVFFQKRHVLTHNNGIIDQRYVQNTNSNQGLIGQRITISEYEITQALKYLSNIVEDIEKI